MEDPLESHHVCKCIPFMLILKIATIILMLFYLIFGIFVSFFIIDSPGLIAFAIMAFIFFGLTLLYFDGIRRKNDFLMIPFLVAEILFRVIIGFLICFLWGTFVLSSFDMFIVNSPIKGMSGTKFIFYVSIISTIIYAAFIYLLFPFYRGYRIIKKNKDIQKFCAEECAYMKVSFTSRPTTV
uniref:Uncharacterized protein n=1 Tax=Panagrolaimus sp. PS1159 TaxID=55785 RepID=A0AC35FLS9_9BILA